MNALDVAELYWSTFSAAARYAVWSGGHWTPQPGRPTNEAIIAALTADGPPLSGFFLTDDSTTHVLAIDVDLDDGWPLLEAVADRLLRADVPCYIEHSRRGGHLWAIAAAPVPAIVARYALMAAIEAARFKPVAKEIELRPASERHTSEFAGGSLRLPWMAHPATGERFGLLDPTTGKPLHPKIAGALLRIDLAPVRTIERLAERYIPERTARPAAAPRMDSPGVSAVLAERFGLEAQPGHSVRCPFHPDEHPSMKIAADDQRAWCHSPACEAHEDGRGITAWMAARLAGVS
jgi:hypothetical protein